jgi:hypothetical protein
MNTRALITGVAALFLATGTAHAGVLLSPTDPLIGSWCEIKDSKLLKRGPKCDTIITKSGYNGVEDSCAFVEIKRIPNGIEALSDCISEDVHLWGFHYENVRFQIIGKRLKIETLKTYSFKTTQIDTGDTHRSMCVEVQPTPNGYLNVRQGPGMNFKPIAKLVPGQRILVDFQTDEWTHMRSICNEKGDLDGWVYTKYVTEKPESKCDISRCDR